MGTYAGETLSSPQHALDNDGFTEFLMFDFGTTAWALTNTGLGYVNNDSDLSVLAHTGGASPFATLPGETLSQAGTSTSMASPYNTPPSGNWTVVGNYANVGSNQNLGNTGPGQIFSSFWIVAAYNSAFGGAHPNSSGVLSLGYSDYFKVKTITGVQGSIPAPGPATLVLFVLGLAGFAAGRSTR